MPVRTTLDLDINEAKSALSQVLKEYHDRANSNPHELRKLIPSREVWRFFITKKHQQNGRDLKSRLLTAAFDPVKDYTIYRYITEIEKSDLTQSESIASNSLYRRLKNLTWDLNIDQLKSLTIQNLRDLDFGWIPYEINEPGYLKSLYISFNEIFNNQDLTIKSIKKLHETTISSTQKTRYELPQFKAIARTKFRKNWDLWGCLSSTTCTFEGILEILDKQKRPYYDHLKFQIEFNDSIYFLVTSNVIKELQTSLASILNDTSKLASIFSTTTEALSKSPELLDKIKNICRSLCKKPAITLHEMVTDREFPVGLASTPKVRVGDVFRGILNTYNSDIQKASTDMEKMTAIVTFILDCAQLIPFYGANGRLFCMTVLNILLIRNGFPLTILDDQNQFICFSKDQLILAVIKGMENTFSLIRENHLFGVQTSTVYEKVKTIKLNGLDQYFDELEKIEDKFRQDSSETLDSSKNIHIGEILFRHDKEDELLADLINTLDLVYPEKDAAVDEEINHFRKGALEAVGLFSNKFLSKAHRMALQNSTAELKPIAKAI